MKTGIRFLTLAWLLLALPCSAAPERTGTAYPVNPVATFDHDPMSITMTSVDVGSGFTAPSGGHHRKSHRGDKRRLRRSGPAADASLSLNYIPLETNATLQVNVTDKASWAGRVIHLILYRGFVRDQKFKRKLDYDTPTKVNDYKIDTQYAAITNGAATFNVTFHLPAITPHSRNSESDATEDDPDLPPYKYYRKIYIVATLLADGVETKQYCFQTITVYDPTRVPSATYRRAPSGHRRNLPSRTKKKA